MARGARGAVSEAADRLGPVIELITSIAQGDLDVPPPQIADDPDLEAIVLGLQMLAEELHASRETLRGRTAELERSNSELEHLSRGFIRLSELGNLLLACNTSGEAYAVVGRAAREIYGDVSGAVYLTSASRDLVEVATSWGDLPVASSFPPEDCWALRRGRVHYGGVGAAPICSHTGGGEPRAALCVPMLAQGEALGVLVLVARPETAARALTPSAQRLAVAAAEECGLALANMRLREKLSMQAVRDPLTGLYNRRFAEEAIEREIGRAKRGSAPLSLVILDLDNFRAVNDEHGHDGGDVALREAATLFAEGLRSSDIACRLGGDEFLLVFPDATVESAIHKSDDLRARLKKIQVFHRGRRLQPITFSAGAASYPADGGSAGEIMRAADAALYRAKAAGRDRADAART